VSGKLSREMRSIREGSSGISISHCSLPVAFSRFFRAYLCENVNHSHWEKIDETVVWLKVWQCARFSRMYRAKVIIHWCL